MCDARHLADAECSGVYLGGVINQVVGSTQDLLDPTNHISQPVASA